MITWGEATAWWAFRVVKSLSFLYDVMVEVGVGEARESEG